MIMPIIIDENFLAIKSSLATKDDLYVAENLLDTLAANADRCVGMAANMIGISKCVIAFNFEDSYMIMFNPKILKCEDPYQTEEGCLSHSGTRKAKRYKTIKVEYQNISFQLRIKTFRDWSAQIIQHEIDHCNGIIV